MQIDQTLLAVDVETTGLAAGINEIIEIGAAKIEKGCIRETFVSLIRPKYPLPPQITELTGITPAMLLPERTLHEVLPEFLAFAGELPLLGHNLPFDYSFLKAACQSEKLPFEKSGVDTLFLLKVLVPSLDKKNLSAAAAVYGINPGQAHRACDDAITCAHLYLKLKEQFASDPAKQDLFLPQSIQVRIKKQSPATEKQKKYLLDLLKYHRIEDVPIERVTKSMASALIDFLRTGQKEKAMELLASAKEAFFSVLL